jgi:hypothetical protein
VAEQIAVYIESGAKRTFASAADWPGWCRSGKDEKTALENLAAYAPRYARVSRLAKVTLPENPTAFKVVERLKGNATTDFGAPGIAAKAESKPLTAKQADRILALLDACWKYLDQVRADTPKELRKGPRGGGRDRDKMWQHVLGAESAYASAAGVRLKEPDGTDGAAVSAFRKAFREGLAEPTGDGRWPIPYAVRRTAWHALDHAWEMEDRLPSSG